MGVVIYSLNGKKFRDFGVYVSASEGLLDKPKPKTRKSYNWAEYHGSEIDLSPLKYEEREIELKCWIKGENWQRMKSEFDTLFSEFDREGLARLVVEFGDVLVYDVYLSSGIELKKTFKKGKIIGEFSLKMKEPQPIKKVLKFEGGDLRISFNSEGWVDISINGMLESVTGIVNFRKTFPRGIHYIIISGNIEEIINLQTNAEIL